MSELLLRLRAAALVNKDGWTCHYYSTTIIFQKRLFLNGSNAQGNPYRFTQAAQSWRLLIHYLNRQAARGSSGVTERRCGLTQYGKPNSRQIMTA
ncbi:hypothetical protein Q8A67_008692 [Cirrhinus molitorella]|uniref:Uncharacterized protein n=1 Tax=Cirrhinus molitorella TaxID=172907 RepID=A0AA88TZD9_9TELE|nr:hypothetical protein Q8A67_008692 [Cirrhinus molitorella]